jgi:hypothetical protein
VASARALSLAECEFALEAVGGAPVGEELALHLRCRRMEPAQVSVGMQREGGGLGSCHVIERSRHEREAEEREAEGFTRSGPSRVTSAPGTGHTAAPPPGASLLNRPAAIVQSASTRAVRPRGCSAHGSDK